MMRLVSLIPMGSRLRLMRGSEFDLDAGKEWIYEVNER
jgi:hypothetical protein